MLKLQKMLSAGALLLAFYGLLILSGCQAGGNEAQTNIHDTDGSPALDSSVVLQCVLHTTPLTADTASISLFCTIANAARGQTSFEVTYSTPPPMTPKGNEGSSKCGGPLHDGAGSCTITFIINAFNVKLGTITGELLPSHHHFGPVTPKIIRSSNS